MAVPASQLAPLIWIDIEATGLSLEQDTILEVACLITDHQLNPLNQGIDVVIHQPNEVLDSMDQWCTQTHKQSGLTAACTTSKINLATAEEMLLRYVRKDSSKGTCPIAGNSVGFDRMFIRKHMPRLFEHFHYRIVDVSSVKELCRRWFPDEFCNVPRKDLNHRAMDDVLESIDELKYYRQSIFKPIAVHFAPTTGSSSKDSLPTNTGTHHGGSKNKNFD